MNIEALLERFRDYFRKFDVKVDFRHPKFTEEEYTYKAERGRQMREWLGREALEERIARGKWDEICRHVVRSFAMISGPLARWDEYQWVGGLNPEEGQQFALALYAFLYGDGDFGLRLDRFVEEGTGIYRHFLSRAPEQARKFKGKTLSWPFVSYFHFMMWPDQEYAFVKPDPLRKACQLAGFDLRYDSTPNSRTYARVQEFYRALWPAVKELGGRDWIDVQTFIYFAGRAVPSDWHAKLQEWLRTNPRTMPPELWQLRQEFVQRFPKERLADLTLERYAVGHEGSADSFCYWLEFKTRPLGGIGGGSAAKFGVWWSEKAGRWAWRKTFPSAEAALERIKEGLQRLVEAVEAGRFAELDEIASRTLGRWSYSLRGKPLSLYFPDEFLPIFNPDHLRHFLRCLGQEPEGDQLALNRQLLHFLRSQEEFQGFDTRQMMAFLYAAFPPPTKPEEQPEEEPESPRGPARLGEILAYIEGSPYIFPRPFVVNYHLALKTKPFVILTGLSGTGKTKLTRLYADAVYNIPQGQDNPYYAIVAVQPDWTDRRGLLGYYNPLTRTYEATPFLRFLLKAATDPEQNYYVCLDEMNLARVEYYFADFLSALESGEAVVLHGYAGQCIATHAREGIPPLLPETEELREAGYERNGVLYVPAAIYIPKNLFISGTVNVDETTHAFSDKVLDRANSIEFDRVDLEAYAERYKKRFPNRAGLVDEVMPLLRQVHQLLQPCYLHFGYRTLEEVLAYLWNYRTQFENEPLTEALDNQFMQKILPKLRGDDRIRDTLEKLLELLKGQLGAQSRSVRKLTWMLEELNTFGSTHFWR